MRAFYLSPVLFVALTAFAPETSSQEPAVKSKAGLVVVDHEGKDVPLKNWKVETGARSLNFSSQAKDKKLVGPLYLEFRALDSTLFQDGILTLVPLSSIRKIDYDNPKATVSLTWVGADGKDQVLHGVTKYVGINKLTVEGDVDLGDLGSASVKFLGGQHKLPRAIRGFRFADPKPTPEVAGAARTIVAADKEKSVHKVADLEVLYKGPKGYVRSATLLFKKTLKVDLDQIVSLKLLPSESKKQTANDYEVTLKDGNTLVLSLVKDTHPVDGSPATLVGLLGKVPAGYQLFPPHTIAELRLEPKN